MDSFFAASLSPDLKLDEDYRKVIVLKDGYKCPKLNKARESAFYEKKKSDPNTSNTNSINTHLCFN